MTARGPRRRVTLGHRQLLAAAGVVERWAGVRIEVAGAAEPPVRGKRHGILRQCETQLVTAAGPDLVPLRSASVARPEAGPDAYLTVDLAVCPSGFLESDEALLHPRAVELAVAVVPDGGRRLLETYAAARIRLVLLVDPRRGRWSLNGDPREGRYREVWRGGYGETVALPVPFCGRIDTARFPRYTARAAQ
ncbi:hypothetical protein [Streptomyces carpaticus]|uniref:hypothetical protein n=1 Tax=Streptomyces carpaticus TaxID=285558 RepID=UPI0031F85A27